METVATFSVKWVARCREIEKKIGKGKLTPADCIAGDAYAELVALWESIEAYGKVMGVDLT